MYCESGKTSSLTRVMLLCGVFICVEPGATCKLCLETGKSCRRSELYILVSLSFVFVFMEIAVAPLSSAEAPARFPSENSIKRGGDYGKMLALFFFPSYPARFLFPLSPISLRQKKASAEERSGCS